MEQCPFCMREIPEGATVCTGCNAEKGYMAVGDAVYGRVGSIGCGIVVPCAIALALLFLWVAAAAPGEYWPLYVAAAFLIPVVLSIRRIKAGPTWFRSTGGKR